MATPGNNWQQTRAPAVTTLCVRLVRGRVEGIETERERFSRRGADPVATQHATKKTGHRVCFRFRFVWRFDIFIFFFTSAPDITSRRVAYQSSLAPQHDNATPLKQLATEPILPLLCCTGYRYSISSGCPLRERAQGQFVVGWYVPTCGNKKRAEHVKSLDLPNTRKNHIALVKITCTRTTQIP